MGTNGDIAANFGNYAQLTPVSGLIDFGACAGDASEAQSPARIFAGIIGFISLTSLF